VFSKKYFQRVPRQAEAVGQQVPYGSRVLGKLLASGKLVYREVCSDESQPANSGTDPGTLRYGAGEKKNNQMLAKNYISS